MTEFSEQAFLLDFIHFFPNRLPTGKGKTITAKDDKIGKVTLLPPYPYEHVMRVEGDPTASINKLLYSTLWHSKEFDNFTPAQLSYLTPRIEIYKRRQLDNGKWIEIPFPINAVTTTDSITTSLEGRGTDVALTSLTWQDTGTDTAFAGITMAGIISLTFQSFESLFMDRPTAFGDEIISFAELTTNVPTKKKTGPATDVEAAVTDANKADSPFEIKLVVGWSVPDDVTNEIFESYQLNAIRNAISVLNVTTNQNDIVIGDGGKVDLKCHFTGRLETKMHTEKYNLFLIDTETLAAQQRKQDLNGINKVQSKLAKEEAEAENKIVSKHRQTKDKLIEQSMEAATLARFSLKAQPVQDAWSAFLAGIASLGGYDEEENGRIFSVDITAPLYEYYQDLLAFRQLYLTATATREKYKKDKTAIDITDEALQEYSNKRLAAKEALWVGLLDSELVGVAKENLIAKAVSIKNIKNNEGVEKFGKAANDFYKRVRHTPLSERYDSEFAKFRKSGFEPQSNLVGTIQFFFLGDLFEAAMNIIINRPDNVSRCVPGATGKTNPASKKMADEARLLLGTIKMTNPDTGDLSTHNIADIPISVDAFLTWFESEITRHTRAALPLRMFLGSVASSLISNVLRLQAPDKITNRRPTSVIKLTTLDLPAKGMADTIWKKYSKVMNVNGLVELAHEKGMGMKDGKNMDTVQFIYLYCNELPQPVWPHNAMKQWDANVKLGIPHLFVGNNEGMVKKVAFSRTPIAGHRESSILRAVQEGKDFKSMLLSSDKYDITMDMFGNPFYKPGMQIYVDPRSLGLGYAVSADWATDLGLGGLYSIFSVQNTVKSGLYETKIQAKSEVGLGLKKHAHRKNKAVPKPKISDPSIHHQSGKG